ncbi:hypothetical protein [Streptomyces sp. HC307]|uniref:hypothetical protein n=1 Tax=Streptomyces flavusporus TaxID=3385496 RepID=UPI0039174798
MFIQNPTAGTWTIQVIASQVNADGHVEIPATDADFGAVNTAKGQPGGCPLGCPLWVRVSCWWAG